MTFTRCIALALGAAALATSAMSQQFPDHTLRFVVGYPPGQNVDMMARAFADAMGKELGQNIIVDNKPGANGILGAQTVKTAKADGYTLLFGTSGQLAINQSLYKKLPYDTLKDFLAVGIAGTAPLVLVANPGFAPKNVQELLAYVKAHPGKVDFGSGGSGITAHLAMELFQEASGVKLNHIPYKGSPAAMNDLMGGQIPLMMEPLPSVLPYVRAGKLKALAITSPRRNPSLPDVPTVAEQLQKDFDVAAWSGIVVPAGTPAPVVARLSEAFRKAGHSPAVQQMLASSGLEFPTMSTPQFQAFMEAEVKKWARAVQQSGAQVD
ncbi:Bug family tripartite tricarboxylate transporter substrate binding protein [Variovorax sp. RA8]|uniref:Bug family tripartite tricarboxylate transporter substrate binding protein n=1 Tax=Variovorax sp. (strain JCM 16519 / RA8) TaxID=662548 RepID=UPI00131888F3|nr:tripartite tricarboxylate transporter substrate binding protein [Variovorax sp. RA8]VTU16184.1 Argininosuccinate lyase [Variovorax sp. RA8]